MWDRRAEFGNINENERNGGIYCGRGVAAKQLIFTNFDILLTQPKPGPLLAKTGDGMETTRVLDALAYLARAKVALDSGVEGVSIEQMQRLMAVTRRAVDDAIQSLRRTISVDA